MKIVVYTHLKGFQFSSSHISRIKAVADVEVAQPKSEDEFHNELRNAEVLICGNYNFRKEWLEKAPELKYVHAMAAGVERILPHLPESILLANAKGVHSINIAEQVLGYMTMHERRLDLALRAQLQRKWIANELALGAENEPGELHAKAVAVFGLGNIGKRIAEVCKCIGMHVIGVKRVTGETLPYVDALLPFRSFAEALREADYVVAALPYTRETRHFFNRKAFSLMKNNAFFINIGRGAVVAEKELIEVLKEKKIAGAALDVFEEEPLPESSELWNLPNVIITPHSAGFTTKYVDRFVEIFCENLKAFVKEEQLPNLVNKEKGY